MSAASDATTFARYFDFDSEHVSIADLIQHLRVMGMEDLNIGMPNAMAALAAADLLQRTCSFLPVDKPGALIKQLQSIDSDTWGEML